MVGAKGDNLHTPSRWEGSFGRVTRYLLPRNGIGVLPHILLAIPARPKWWVAGRRRGFRLGLSRSRLSSEADKPSTSCEAVDGAVLDV